MKLRRQISGDSLKGTARKPASPNGAGLDWQPTNTRVRQTASRVVVLDEELAQTMIRERQRRGIDGHDEIWEGVYIVPPLANNRHQAMVLGFSVVLFNVITLEQRGHVLPGANVSDRRSGWETNYRAPDIVVVLTDGRAIDCNTHWWGGPDFLIEIQNPNDDTDEKLPFYSKIQVREVLIVDRDTRQLRLHRHDGQQLQPVAPSDFQGNKGFLSSEVIPLAFRRRARRGGPRVEVCRTDGKPGTWTV
jgi:Uma2 family endonuclease